LNLKNLFISIAFLIVAILIYILKKDWQKRKNDKDYGERAITFSQKFNIWCLISLSIIISIIYLFKAFL